MAGQTHCSSASEATEAGQGRNGLLELGYHQQGQVQFENAGAAAGSREVGRRAGMQQLHDAAAKLVQSRGEEPRANKQPA